MVRVASPYKRINLEPHANRNCAWWVEAMQSDLLTEHTKGEFIMWNTHTWKQEKLIGIGNWKVHYLVARPASPNQRTSTSMNDSALWNPEVIVLAVGL